LRFDEYLEIARSASLAQPLHLISLRPTAKRLAEAGLVLFDPDGGHSFM